MDPLLRGSYFFEGTPINQRSKEEEERFFKAWVKDLEEDEEKEMPPLRIVRFPDLVKKAWGWEKLLPICAGIEWSDYGNYLKEYYKNNAPGNDDTGSTLVAFAKRCLEKEVKLASKWNELDTDVVLHRQYIISSSLIKECAQSFIIKEMVEFDPYVVAAFLCIEKETDLVLKLLERGARPDCFLIEESCAIRMCALGLIGHSDTAAGAMLGITNETSRILKWLSDNKKLDILCLLLPDRIEEARMTRCRTLEFMASILIMPYTAAAAVLKPVMDYTDTRGNGASAKLNCQDHEKIIDADNSKKRKRFEEMKKEFTETQGCKSSWLPKHSQHDDVIHCLDLASMGHAPYLGHGDAADWGMKVSMIWPAKCPEFHVEKAWGFGRLLPFNGSVKWSDYMNYLFEYYNRNALPFLREVVACDPGLFHANEAGNCLPAALYCSKMEEYLLSEWRIHLSPAPDYFFPVNTIIESALIRNRALESSKTMRDESCVASTIAFMCIALEADLMCELLRHGAKPTDDIIEQSSVIRMCALSILNLKGDQSVLAAAAGAMVGITKETIMIIDWVKKEKKLVNFCSSTPRELAWSCFIRVRLLYVMTTIVQKSVKLEHDAVAEE